MKRLELLTFKLANINNASSHQCSNVNVTVVPYDTTKSPPLTKQPSQTNLTATSLRVKDNLLGETFSHVAYPRSTGAPNRMLKKDKPLTLHFNSKITSPSPYLQSETFIYFYISNWGDNLINILLLILI